MPSCAPDEIQYFIYNWLLKFFHISKHLFLNETMYAPSPQILTPWGRWEVHLASKTCPGCSTNMSGWKMIFLFDFLITFMYMMRLRSHTKVWFEPSYGKRKSLHPLHQTGRPNSVRQCNHDWTRWHLTSEIMVSTKILCFSLEMLSAMNADVLKNTLKWTKIQLGKYRRGQEYFEPATLWGWSGKWRAPLGGKSSRCPPVIKSW